MSCAKFSRWGLIIFNTLFLIAGLAITGAASYAYYESQQVNLPMGIAIGLIVVSVVVVVVAILGLVAASIANRALLWIYFVLMICLLAGELCVAIYAYTNSSTIQSQFDDFYHNSATPAQRQKFEDTLYCCGYGNVTDDQAGGLCCQLYNNLTVNTTSPTAVPITTYSPPTQYCLYNSYTSTPGYVEPCHQAIMDFYNAYIKYFEAGAGVLAGIEVFGIIFSFFLALKAKEISKDIEMNDYS